jgi:SAM-dependent methyltransferase
MPESSTADLARVQSVYSGPEFQLWELLMGQQIHIGGLPSSHELAEKARIAEGSQGVDLCCCTGAGMRFLARYRNVKFMDGVDATETVVQLGRERCRQEGLDDRMRLIIADACQTGLPDQAADFVWGEDAWCYVVDKPQLIAEAVRLVKPGGTIAFTDWVEGPAPLNDQERERLLGFMKFPNIQGLTGYGDLLGKHGCQVLTCEDTGRFQPHVELYLNMLQMQLSYDALKILGFDTGMFEAILGEMAFMRQLASEQKLVQGRFVASKPTT